MTQMDTPPLVAVVEAVLGTKVLALRYLPSPAASRHALARSGSGGRQLPSEVAYDHLLEVGVAEPSLGRVPGPAEVELTTDDESSR